jgi:Glycosyl transferase family 2
MSQPAQVSVCIPSHNGARFLGAAVDSVLTQDFEDFELLVSDDASTDETQSVCKRYDDPRFRVVRSDSRLGQSGNWNRCVELATGTYVILLHADDELQPTYLRRAIEVLDEHPDVALVHSAVQHVDESGMPLSVQRLYDEEEIDRNGATLRRLLLDGCVINPAGVLVRREAYARTGPFTDQVVWGVDWHMWTRIALQFPVAYLTESLALYRQHGGSGTATAVMTTGRNARDELWVVQDLFSLIERTRPELAALKPEAVRGVAHRTWCFAETMCQLGEMRAARTGLRNAIRIWPPMVGEARVWGLWAATFTGYRWFAAAHSARQRVVNNVRKTRQVTVEDHQDPDLTVNR